MSSKHLSFTFNSPTWSETVIKESNQFGLKLSHATTDRVFNSEDIKGTGLAAYILTYLPNNKDAHFTGHMVFKGTVCGKEGSFALGTIGTYVDTVVKAEWTVVPGTGIGELEGISGKGQYSVNGHEQKDLPGTLDLNFA